MRRVFCMLLALLLLSGTALAGEPAGVDNWYEIFVRSYCDSDGDGLGDLPGVLQKLDYIDGMGYTGLWLMPVMPSPSYHKYDVTDYCAIDPEYGTMEDMRALTEACHARGIRLIIDLPINHTSTEHPWFLEACADVTAGRTDTEAAARYCFTRTPDSKSVPVGDTGWYYEEQFSGGGMPDLNLDNPSLRRELRDIAAFWLCDVGVDGFRLDAVTSYYAQDHDANVRFLHDFKECCEELSPGSFLVGEAWTGLGEIAHYYESGVDCFFLFPASQAEGFICKALRSRSKPAEEYARALQSVEAAIPDGLLAPFLSNHDTGRTVGSLQARQAPAKAKFAEAVLQMTPGAVFTYYGEEIGMVGAGADPNKRLPMDWCEEERTDLPPGTDRVEYAYPCVYEQEADPGSLLNYCRRLNAIKKAYPALAAGRNEILLAEGYCLLMRRTLDDVSLLIAMNFSAGKEQTIPLPCACVLEEELQTGDGSAVPDAEGLGITLPGYGLAILRPQ